MKKKLLVSFTVVIGLVFGTPALADEAQDKAVSNGYAHYKIFCSNCHGVNAEGKGKLASELGIAPSDLTALQQTGGDICIAERVLKAVSGMHEVPAGQTQMPTFSGNLESITIYELTQFLKAIQK